MRIFRQKFSSRARESSTAVDLSPSSVNFSQRWRFAPPDEILDNYATRKHEKVISWQRRNPRFHFHFTPSSASWLNMVEHFFRDLTVNSIRSGCSAMWMTSFKRFEDYVAAHNADPKPIIWTASASDILETLKRGRRKLDNMQSA